MSNPRSILKKTPITDKNGVKSSRLKKSQTVAKAATTAAKSSSKTPAQLAPAQAETVRDGILRSWLANGLVETKEEAVEKFAALVAELGTPHEGENEGQGGARLNRLAATYYMEWPELELDISSATPSQSSLEHEVEVNEFMFAAATENILTTEYGYPNAHETLIGNRATLRRMFMTGVEPGEFAQWVFER